LKINIKGPIIPNNHQWIYDWLDMEATSPKKVIDELEKANNQDIEVEINSGGGSVYDASEIYTAIKKYPGKTTGDIVGIAASAASVIAMAPDKLRMSPTAQMMIHNASTRASGDYRDMDQTSNMLKNTNQTIANAYSMKSGKSYDELLSMMDDETWLTAQQALEYNLIDEVMFQEEATLVASTTEDGGLLPKKVIDKIRNEFNSDTSRNKSLKKQVLQAPKANVVAENQQENELEEDEEIMNLEDLKNKHPELYNQVRNEGYESGVQDENSRIKSIENLGVPGSEELVNKAKFDERITAEALAVQIITSQKEKGNAFLQNRETDSEDLNNIAGADAPATPDDEAVAQNEGSKLASLINKKRGGVK
jgi:ATP-dependent Clp protease, protease subunit